MNKIKLICIYFLLVLCSFCNSKREKTTTNINTRTINIEAKDITLEKFESNKKNFARIIPSEKVEYIPLETTEKGMIGNIEKVLFINNKFFILDQKNSKGVFVFSDKGSFLFKIQNHGNGPGEFSRITDFNYNKSTNQIEIFDVVKRKIIVYNLEGEFIKEDMAVNSHSFFPLNENERYFYSKFLPIKDELKLNENYRLLKSNKNGDILHSALRFNNEVTYKSGIINAHNNFCQSNNNNSVLFMESYNNNIYEINKDFLLNIKYKLNFKNSNIPENFLESNMTDKFKYVFENKLAYLSNILFEDDKELYFWYSKTFRREVVFNKKNNTYTECINYFITEDNIYLPPCIYVTDGFSISILEHYSLKEQEKEDQVLGEKIAKELKNSTELSNPILVKINR